jgi:16S rRNA (cytosine1402-N4)-methyltransferase
VTARHIPVMTERVLALLGPALTEPSAVLVDATLGLGGHAEAALTAHPRLRLIGLDRDAEAIEASRIRLSGFADRVTLVHAVYDRLPEVLAELGLPSVQGVLFDLGVSSLQLDEARRGFAYAQDAPLDMRMDQSSGATAADVINDYDADALARVLREYGDERFAGPIARAIVRRRSTGPLTSSAELAELVRSAIPAAARRTGGHPAKRTFQALRIEVNGEMAALRAALPAALAALAPGGRVVVLSYHSLEDRIVKRALTDVTTVDLPRGLPVIPDGMRPQFRTLTRGGERPDGDEVTTNPRAKSARLRAVERIEAA